MGGWDDCARNFVAVLSLWTVTQVAWSEERSAVAADVSAQATRLVMTWVPPYAVVSSQQQLNRLYAGTGPRNSLTYLGLQF